MEQRQWPGHVDEHGALGYTRGRGVVDGGTAGTTGGVTPPFAALLAKGEGTETGAPKAYLNFLVFDRDYHLLDGGFIGVTTAAREYGQDGAHEELSKQLIIQKAGYVYLYLSNDNAALGGSAVEVFFDDFTVEHIKSPVVQQDDYYAFGLNFNSYQRENSAANKWKFQGQEHITDLDLGWDSFKWRNHMPDIGRFFNVDPLATDYYYNSPYAFSENSVIKYVELEGLEAKNPQTGNTKKDEEPGFFERAFINFFNLTNDFGKSLNEGQGRSGDDVDENIKTAIDFVGQLPLMVQGHMELLQPSAGSNVVNKTDDVVNKVDDVVNQTKTAVDDVVKVTGKGTQNPAVKEAVENGKKAHDTFSKKAADKGWTVNPRLKDPETGRTVIPDAVTPSGHPVELKPNTESGRAKGAKQLPKYERATGTNGRVIFYDPPE